MKKIILTITFIFSISLQSQWKEIYATYDDETNGTGDNTVDVSVIKENKFVALCTQKDNTCYLIPYVNADSALGRKQFYGYSPATDGFFQKWASGFDEVQLLNAWHAVIGPDTLLYVANNDSLHNILVFGFDSDTIISVDFRLETGNNSLSGISVDKNGLVYVLNDTSIGKNDDLKIYPPKSQWSPTRIMNPIKTINLPDGIYKSLAVSNDGKQIFVTDYLKRKILKYIITPQSNYVLDENFNFVVSPLDTNRVTAGLDTAYVTGLAHLKNNNLLYVALNKYFGGSSWYKFAKIYTLNPNSGVVIDTINQAQWNFNLTGGYNKRGNGTTPGNASGYASPYDLDFDENKNLYTISYYGWTVEKWNYTGTLPTIISSVKQISNSLPKYFTLEQNYPNPFNPTTIIRFSILKDAEIKLTIKNILGQVISTPVNEKLNSGTHEVKIDFNNLPSGNYYYTISDGVNSITKKMMFLQ